MLDRVSSKINVQLNDEKLEGEWMIWRVWLKGNDSLYEIKHKWSLSDLIDANAMLDFESEYQKAYEAEIAKDK